jgi:hypothetical protein
LTSLLEIIDFNPRHSPYIGDDVPIKVIRRLAKGGPCKTIKFERKYLAGVGLCRLHDHAAEAWMLVNPRYRHSHAKTVLKTVRYLLDSFQISEGFTRVQIVVKSRHESFVKWSELLGFEFEGVARAAAEDGDNLILMSRLR